MDIRVHGIAQEQSTTIPEGVQRYLRGVTCLLPQQRVQEVRAELLGHLYQAQLDAQVSGLPQAEAWAVALHEAGPVLPAALRFARLYTLGLLLRWGLVGVVLGGAAYAVQGQSNHSGHLPTVQQAQP